VDDKGKKDEGVQVDQETQAEDHGQREQQLQYYVYDHAPEERPVDGGFADQPAAEPGQAEDE